MPTTQYQTQWGTEQRRPLDPEDWQRIWQAVSLSSKNVLIVENSYKVLYRWYYTTARLAEILPNYCHTCFCSCLVEGTMVHIWWTCQVVSRLWIWVYNLIHSLIHTSICKNPFKALLNKPISDIFKSERTLAFHI